MALRLPAINPPTIKIIPNNSVTAAIKILVSGLMEQPRLLKFSNLERKIFIYLLISYQETAKFTLVKKRQADTLQAAPGHLLSRGEEFASIPLE